MYITVYMYTYMYIICMIESLYVNRLYVFFEISDPDLVIGAARTRRRSRSRRERGSKRERSRRGDSRWGRLGSTTELAQIVL